MHDELPSTEERAIFLDHGVDLKHFRAVPREEQPIDIRDLPRPRIGIFGSLDDYIVDFDLLERVAADFPDASLVLVGDATCSMERFSRFPNEHWLGFRPYEKIPGYGSAFDVALLPLELGLSVVTTDFTEPRDYANHLVIARSADVLVSEIRRLLDSSPNPSSQRAAVLNKSWAHRATLLIDLCEGRIQSSNLEVS
jgi:hypothetical protein